MSKDRFLLIVESPTKVKTIRTFLPSNYIVMASKGHISEIKDGGSYWNTGINPNDDFKTDYVVSSDKKELIKELKEQVELASKVIIASDPDREGEAIAWSLKKFLKIPKSKCERVTFHEINKNAVLKALNNPRDIDENLVNAAHSRRILDKIIGFRLTPIARKQVYAKSVGRCQGAGLKLICDKEKEIKEFVPETYYELYLLFNKDKQEFKAKYIGTKDKEVKRISSKEDMFSIVNDCKNGTYSIANITTKERFSNPKPPFTTSTFLQEVSNKLGIRVGTATDCAQQLFEGIDVGGQHVGLITYIRTDDATMSPEFQNTLKSFVIDTYGKEYFAPLKEAKKSENAQEGHECLRVLDLSMTPEKLSKYIDNDLLIKIYNIIYKRTVASMMAPQKLSETTYVIENGDHRFQVVSREELFDGYKKVYGVFDKEEEEIVKVVLPIKVVLPKGYVIKNGKLEGSEKQTTPPSRFKEATFIKELETRGIGRPSTYKTINDTLLSETRGYCKVEDKCIVPTELGMKLSDFLEKSFSNVISVDYTSKLEKSLDLIANGKLDMLEFLKDFYTTLEESASKFSKSTTQKAQPTNEVCPLCGAPMVLRTNKSNGQQFYGCSKFPKCKGVKQVNS